MDFDLKYFLKKIDNIEHPVLTNKKEVIYWILQNFVNKNLQNELIYKPILKIRIKLKYIKKYMHCSKEVVYIEELLDTYEKEEITNLSHLSITGKQIDKLMQYIDDLYTKSLKNNDILYFDDNLTEYIEVLDLENDKPKFQESINIDDETIEIICDLDKTMKLVKINSNCNEKTDDDIEILDYLDKTMKFTKLNPKEIEKLDINDETIEVLKDLEKTLIIDKPIKNEEIEILDYLDKTIQIPKLTKKELKKLDINDETIEVLDFLDKTRKIPKIKEIEVSKDDLIKIKALEKTVKINRYQITDSIIKEMERRKKRRKMIFASVLSILCFTFFVSSYRIIAWYKNNLDLKKEIETITNNVEVKEYDEENNLVEKEDELYASESLIDVDFDELLKTNTDTIGWIYVPSTNIDYPIVQTTDNKYYLTHSFTKSYNDAGWVFMDYRNKTDVLDFNTIIYAHGRLDKTMFGSLRNALEEDWYMNEENHYIKLAMLSNSTLWQVFSVYKIETETYYLQNNFSSYEKHKSYLDTIIERSIYDFNVNVTPSDKIITLSTCYDNFNKVVVHAKMIKQYNK